MADKSLTEHRLDGLTDSSNRLRTELQATNKELAKVPGHITHALKDVWDSIADQSHRTDAVLNRVVNLESAVVKLQKADQQHEKAVHGQARYLAGWQKGLWAGIGAALALGGAKHATILDLVRSAFGG